MFISHRCINVQYARIRDDISQLDGDIGINWKPVTGQSILFFRLDTRGTYCFLPLATPWKER